MKKNLKIVFSAILFFTILFIVGCSNNNEYVLASAEPGQQQAPISTQGDVIVYTDMPIFTSSPVPTITAEQAIEKINVNDLPPGLYIVSMSYPDNRLNIWTTEGVLLGYLLEFSLRSRINPDYDLLAYASSHDNFPSNDSLFAPDFAVYDLETNEVTSYQIPDYEYAMAYDGSWSPDGRMFVMNIMNAATEIFDRLGILNLAEGNLREIPIWDGEASDPDWSPDGKYIVFTSGYSPYDGLGSKIFLMNTNCLLNLSSCPENVSLLFSKDDEDYDSPTWSPDSQKIAFTCMNEKVKICIGDINSGEIIEVPNLEFEGWGPDWSPNGEWISFSDDGKLYIIKPDGSESRLIAKDEDFQFWIEIPD